jgi:hypothetical protein
MPRPLSMPGTPTSSKHTSPHDTDDEGHTDTDDEDAVNTTISLKDLSFNQKSP